MARKNPKRDLRRAQRNLLSGYRDALQRAESLNVMSGAFVRHVVAVSADAARSGLITRADATELAAELAEFAEEVRRLDHVGKAIDYAAKEAMARSQAIVGLVATGTLIAVPLSFLNDVMSAGQELRHRSGVDKYLLPGVLKFVVMAVAAHIANSYNDALSGVWHGPTAGYTVLSENVDAPEREFFQSLATTPPNRPIGRIMGPFLGIVLVLVTAVVGLFLLTLVSG
jgi:tetrahydromethanopterin S-methyltransferase subunit G